MFVVAERRERGRLARCAVLCLGAFVLTLSCRGEPEGDTRAVPSARPGPAPKLAAVSKQAEALSSVSKSISVVDQQDSRRFELKDLLTRLGPEAVTTQDPYYRSEKRFMAVSLSTLLSELWPDWTSESPAVLELEAVDGYRARISSALAFHPDAYLAFFDLRHPPFAPIGEQEASPAPLYLVWRGAKLTDLRTHPRPWGIVRFRRVPAHSERERLKPAGGFDSDAAEAGYTIFGQECVRCHSMNQQGGKVGPDLNVPQNILEYRPIDQVKAYIKDPATFRYSTMPAHPDLSDADLNNLIAYFRLMQDHKHDPHKERP